MNIFYGLVALSSLYLLGAAASAQQPLNWPAYGPDQDYFRVDDGIDRGDGLTNGVPDIVGPVDGSAKLTIFTEGNHYPVLLPLALEAFPRYCARTETCAVTAQDITIVTLPQVMIVAGLEKGGFRFGNARLPVRPGTPVFPDLLMLGDGPMARLEALGLLDGQPRGFAKHRGMGLLMRRDEAEGISDFQSFASSDLPFVVATPRETGARKQYIRTIQSLLGEDATEAIFAREVTDFPGRLAIQHRDIPYAVMNDIAPVGIVFGHLAKFYAGYWPDQLAFVEIPDAAAFGTEIFVAKTRKENAEEANRTAFLAFLLDAAPEAYEKAGFAAAKDFEFGRALDLN